MSDDGAMSGQLPIPLANEDKASFDNFWTGHNFELVSALRSSVTTGEPKVVYFYGPPGCGKSHLLYAAMRLAREEIINTSYLSLSEKSVSPEMLEVIDVAHVVCVDNIQAWAGDEHRERALFTLFEQIKHAGGQLLVAALQRPESSGFAIRDLVSRLSSGLIYPIKELSDEQRVEAIKLRAQYRGLSMTEEVVKYLVSRAPRDTAVLFNVLDDIDRKSLVEKRRVTIPFLQDLLKQPLMRDWSVLSVGKLYRQFSNPPSQSLTQGLFML